MPLDDLFDHAVDFPFPAAGGTADAGADSSGGPESDRSEPPPPSAAGPRHPLPASGGVYLLTDADDRLVQLASAGNLRRALEIRLGSPAAAAPSAPAAPRRRADLAQIVRRIRWREAHSAFELCYVHWRIARVLMPQTYPKQLGFGPAWFVHADAEAAIPQLTVGRLLRGPPGTDLGPFFTNRDATRFVQALQDGFDLCRTPPVLERSPRGTACAYFDMGRCPAPCDGSVPMARYGRQVAAAAAFAAGARREACQELEARMRAAAARQAYEEAGRTRQRLDRLRELDQSPLAAAGPIDRFDWLIVQRAGGRTRVKPFFVRAGRIEAGPPVRLRNVEAAAPDWIAAFRPADAGPAGADRTPPAAEADLTAWSEQVWLVAHFLCKKEPPGLFVAARALPEAAELAHRIREHFARPEKTVEPQPPAEPDPPPDPRLQPM